MVTHEFFELYNEYNTAENLDNYTVVVYYEEAGGKSGFYVFDLPNDSVACTWLLCRCFTNHF